MDMEKTWSQQRNGDLKTETKEFLQAARDQALRTNAIKAKIEKTTDDSKGRSCKEKEETVAHLVSASSKIAHTDYLYSDITKWPQCLNGIFAKNITYLQHTNIGKTKSIRSCRKTTSKYYGILRFNLISI